MRDAVAVEPLPPSFDVTAPVVLVLAPGIVPVTSTAKVHEAPPASEAPDRLTLLASAAATIVPPPQLPITPAGVATTSPAGSGSVTLTPVSVVDALGLAMVKVRDVTPRKKASCAALSGTVVAPKDIEIVGGDGAANAGAPSASAANIARNMDRRRSA